MKSNIRRTFRPTLEALEDRLVPSGLGHRHDGFGRAGGAAVLTAAQPAPAVSSFSWSIGTGGDAAVLSGWDILKNGGTAVLTAAQPAPASPPAVGLTLPPGLSTMVTAAVDAFLKINGPVDQFSISFSKVD